MPHLAGYCLSCLPGVKETVNSHVYHHYKLHKTALTRNASVQVPVSQELAKQKQLVRVRVCEG